MTETDYWRPCQNPLCGETDRAKIHWSPLPDEPLPGSPTYPAEVRRWAHWECETCGHSGDFLIAHTAAKTEDGLNL